MNNFTHLRKGFLPLFYQKTKVIYNAVLLCVSLLLTFSSFSQVSFSGATYTQDFQTLDATALTPATVAQKTMLEVSSQPGGGSVTGWYLYQQENGTARWGRTNGSSSTGSFFGMYDAAATPNRALGSQGSQDIFSFWGIVLKNTSGVTISNITISYDAVIARNPSTTANPYPMSYRVSSTTVASGVASREGTFNDTAGVWTAGTGFTTPASGTGAPGTQAAISPLFRIGGAAITQALTGLNWGNDQYLYIRWKETDNSGSDATAGVDNFSISTNDVVNNSPTILIDPAATTNYLDGGVAVSPSSPYAISGVINDATDPAKTLGIDFTIGDAEQPVGSLTVTATSSNAAVVSNANLVLTGSGASRNLKITPSTNGYTNITIAVSDGTNSTSYILNYAASIASLNPAATKFHTGTSDASSVVLIDNDYMIVADDENQVLRLYNRQNSGLPVNGFDFSSSMNLTDLSHLEVDIESSVKIGSRIYWLGSHDNSSSGSLRVNRYRLFATDISGTGAATTLSYVGRYDGLRTDLLNWDAGNGHGLGANFFGLTASAASGVAPESPDGSGFNIEGITVAPDNTTAYICFRAPIEPASGRTKALIVPVLNFASLVSGNPTAGPATFGAPILLDLGGRGIREIKRNNTGQYIIVAGPHDVATGIAPKDFRLYTWTGIASDAPLLRSADLTAIGADGSIESIVDVPDGLTPATVLQLLTDGGDAVYYNDAVIAKDLPFNNFKKFRSDVIALGDPVCPPLNVTVSAAPIICPGGTTLATVSATGGTEPYTGIGSFAIGAGTYNQLVTDANGCTGTGNITLTALDTIKPIVYLKRSVIDTGLTGPSSTQSPYLKSFKPGLRFKSIISVNDVVGGYRMAGIPDGLGAFDNNDGTFTLLVNHEIVNTLGVVRDHGAKGAFVSKWVINKSNLSVLSGDDLMQHVYLWDTVTHAYVAASPAFSRFCSADLPPVSAFYNSNTGKGTTERIFMDGEESGTEGRAMGHIVTGPHGGTSYELPYLGKFAWENSVASGNSGDKTVVAGMDDGTGGQVYIYIGTKTNTGMEIEKAGLHNGKLYGIKVTGMATEVNGSTPAVGTRFDLVDLGFVQNKTGVIINSESVTAGVTTFLRPEDGSWDPSHPNDFYFATTNAFNSPTRLWRLRFDDITNPETGGTVEAVLNGTEAGQQMFDNLTVDKLGHIMLQEDVGNNAHIGKLWQYNTANDSLFPIAYHDSTRFLIGGANFLTQDEESSGIIDASEILGPGMYLLDVQAHFAPATNTAEVVEGGQLLAMYNPYGFGNSTAPDTVRISTSTPSGTTVDLGTPATADNCSVASLINNAPGIFPVDTTKVIWTVADGSSNSATAEQVVIVTLLANAKPVVSITNPADGTSFPSGSTITVDVNATDSDGNITRVDFYDGAGKFATDSVAPYTLTGQNVLPGTYVLTAKAFDNRGDSTVSDTVRITVTPCTGSGTITGYGYNNITGSNLINLASDPDYPNNPDVIAQLNKFEYGPNIGDNYGARVRGYICAPQTGDYIFYLASDDQSELWLSTDDSPGNISRIAYIESRVGYRSWFVNVAQRSAPIHLVKGMRYYVETVHKEGTGSDHLSVGWKLPNTVFEGPIPGSRLSPWENTTLSASRTAQNFEQAMIQVVPAAATKLTVKATPNPSASYFSLHISSDRKEPVNVNVIDALGRVVETRKSAPANGTLQIGNKLTAGVYIIEVVQGSQREKLKVVRQ